MPGDNNADLLSSAGGAVTSLISWREVYRWSANRASVISVLTGVRVVSVRESVVSPSVAVAPAGRFWIGPRYELFTLLYYSVKSSISKRIRGSCIARFKLQYFLCK